jgi:hypothetical protein
VGRLKLIARKAGGLTREQRQAAAAVFGSAWGDPGAPRYEIEIRESPELAPAEQFFGRRAKRSEPWFGTAKKTESLPLFDRSNRIRSKGRRKCGAAAFFGRNSHE